MISPDVITKIAHLARLQVLEADIGPLQQQLTAILNLMQQLNEVNTDDILPLAHPLEAKQRLREDEVTLSNQQYLELAPMTEAGLYLVPKVIE